MDSFVGNNRQFFQGIPTSTRGPYDTAPLPPPPPGHYLHRSGPTGPMPPMEQSAYSPVSRSSVGMPSYMSTEYGVNSSSAYLEVAHRNHLPVPDANSSMPIMVANPSYDPNVPSRPYSTQSAGFADHMMSYPFRSPSQYVPESHTHPYRPHSTLALGAMYDNAMMNHIKGTAIPKEISRSIDVPNSVASVQNSPAASITRAPESVPSMYDPWMNYNPSTRYPPVAKTVGTSSKPSISNRRDFPSIVNTPGGSGVHALINGDNDLYPFDLRKLPNKASNSCKESSALDLSVKTVKQTPDSTAPDIGKEDSSSGCSDDQSKSYAYKNRRNMSPSVGKSSSEVSFQPKSSIHNNRMASPFLSVSPSSSTSVPPITEVKMSNQSGEVFYNHTRNQLDKSPQKTEFTATQPDILQESQVKQDIPVISESPVPMHKIRLIENSRESKSDLSQAGSLDVEHQLLSQMEIMGHRSSIVENVKPELKQVSTSSSVEPLFEQYKGWDATVGHPQLSVNRQIDASSSRAFAQQSARVPLAYPSYPSDYPSFASWPKNTLDVHPIRPSRSPANPWNKQHSTVAPSHTTIPLRAESQYSYFLPTEDEVTIQKQLNPAAQFVHDVPISCERPHWPPQSSYSVVASIQSSYVPSVQPVYSSPQTQAKWNHGATFSRVPSPQPLEQSYRQDEKQISVSLDLSAKRENIHESKKSISGYPPMTVPTQPVANFAHSSAGVPYPPSSYSFPYQTASCGLPATSYPLPQQYIRPVYSQPNVTFSTSAATAQLSRTSDPSSMSHTSYAQLQKSFNSPHSEASLQSPYQQYSRSQEIMKSHESYNARPVSTATTWPSPVVSLSHSQYSAPIPISEPYQISKSKMSAPGSSHEHPSYLPINHSPYATNGRDSSHLYFPPSNPATSVSPYCPPLSSYPAAYCQSPYPYSAPRPAHLNVRSVTEPLFDITKTHYPITTKPQQIGSPHPHPLEPHLVQSSSVQPTSALISPNVEHSIYNPVSASPHSSVQSGISNPREGMSYWPPYPYPTQVPPGAHPYPPYPSTPMPHSQKLSAETADGVHLKYPGRPSRPVSSAAPLQQARPPLGVQQYLPRPQVSPAGIRPSYHVSGIPHPQPVTKKGVTIPPKYETSQKPSSLSLNELWRMGIRTKGEQKAMDPYCLEAEEAVIKKEPNPYHPDFHKHAQGHPNVAVNNTNASIKRWYTSTPEVPSTLKSDACQSINQQPCHSGNGKAALAVKLHKKFLHSENKGSPMLSADVPTFSPVEIRDPEEDEWDRKLNKFVDDLSSHRQSVTSKKSRTLARRYQQKVQMQYAIDHDQVAPTTAAISEEESDAEPEAPVKFRGKFKSIKDKAVERLILTYASHSDESATEMIADDDASDFEEELKKEIQAKAKKKDVRKQGRQPAEHKTEKSRKLGQQKVNVESDASANNSDSASSASITSASSSDDDSEESSDESDDKRKGVRKRQSSSSESVDFTPARKRGKRKWKEENSDSDEPVKKRGCKGKVSCEITKRKTRMSNRGRKVDSGDDSNAYLCKGRTHMKRGRGLSEKLTKPHCTRKKGRLHCKKNSGRSLSSDDSSEVDSRRRIHGAKLRKNIVRKESKKFPRTVKNSIVESSDEASEKQLPIKKNQPKRKLVTSESGSDRDIKSRSIKKVSKQNATPSKHINVKTKEKVCTSDPLIQKLKKVKEQEKTRPDVQEMKEWLEEASTETQKRLEDIAENGHWRQYWKKPNFNRRNNFFQGWQSDVKNYKENVAKLPGPLCQSVPVTPTKFNDRDDDSADDAASVPIVSPARMTRSKSAFVKTSVDVVNHVDLPGVQKRPAMSNIMQKFLEKVLGTEDNCLKGFSDTPFSLDMFSEVTSRPHTGLTPAPSVAPSMMASDHSDTDSLVSLGADLPASDSVPLYRKPFIANRLIKRFRRKFSTKYGSHLFNQTKTVPKPKVKSELLPTPGLPLNIQDMEEMPLDGVQWATFFRKETIFNYKEQFRSILGKNGFNIFTPIQMASRTRHVNHQAQNSAAIRAVFGEELPKTVNSKTFSNAKKKKLQSPEKKDVMNASREFCSLPSTPYGSLSLLEEHEDSELRSLPSDRSSSLLGDSSLGGSRKYRRKMRKFRSGFDYIRKKKKRLGDETPPPRRKMPSRKHLLWPEQTPDLAYELRTWVINKGLGETVLHKAARLQYHDVVVYCLENPEFDIHVRDNAGYTALHEACNRGHLDIAQLLCAHGAHINAPGYGGMRPLHEAVENGHTELARLLLSYGADPTLTTYAGQPCLALASEGQCQRLIEGHIADLKGNRYEEWHFMGPAMCLDVEEKGCDIFGVVPKNKIAIQSNKRRKTDIAENPIDLKCSEGQNVIVELAVPETNVIQLLVNNEVVENNTTNADATHGMSPIAVQNVMRDSSLKSYVLEDFVVEKYNVESMKENQGSSIVDVNDVECVGNCVNTKIDVVRLGISEDIGKNHNSLKSVEDSLKTEENSVNRSDNYLETDMEYCSKDSSLDFELFSFEQADSVLPDVYQVNGYFHKYLLMKQLLSHLRMNKQQLIATAGCVKTLRLNHHEFLSQAHCSVLGSESWSLVNNFSNVILVRYTSAIEKLLGVERN